MNCEVFTMTKMLKKWFSMVVVVYLCYTSSIKILEIFEPSKSYFLYQMMSPTISPHFFLVKEPSNFW